MDAVKFIKEKHRMCKSNEKCNSCPVSGENNPHKLPCDNLMIEEPEIYVRAVEKWSREHPVKTRQSEFLKIFPNAELNTDGILTVAPCLVDGTYLRSTEGREKCYKENDCNSCRRKYWLAEVD